MQNIYGRYSYGSSPFGSAAQIPANITIQDIIVGETPCTSGCTIICTTGCPKIVDIIITWSNSGGSSGTFTPTITMAEETLATGTQITVAAGGTGTVMFPSVSLQQGISHICINTGTVT